MRLVRPFVLSVAMMIVLAHALIPHHHHSDIAGQDNIEEHNDASSIFDLLALAFHFEQYDGQMEIFVPGSQLHAENADIKIVSLDQDIEFFFSAVEIIDIPETSSGSEIGYIPLSYAKPDPGSSGYRGPPSKYC